MTRRLIFTVDVDRDANIHIDGQSAAGSTDRGQGTAPRFSSSEKGLASITDLLDSLGIKGTFFIEGRTAETIDCSCIGDQCIGFHGYDHEDLTLTEDLSTVMDRGFSAVRDNVSKPVCFRAPFMHTDDRVYDELARLGIGHDSSAYGEPGQHIYDVGSVTVHPVAKGRDRNGRTMAAYLWPMHEGKRVPRDYIDLASSIPDGELLISTHSWHIFESIEKGLLSEDAVRKNISDVESVITGIIDEGFTPSILVV